MAQISVVGAGYVGLVTGACFAYLGHMVTCIDIDPNKVAGLRRGILPIYEPELGDLVTKGLREGRLAFELEPETSIPGSDFVIVAVQTPTNSNGASDLRALLKAFHTFAPLIRPGAVVIQKSTAPVGMAAFLERLIARYHGSSVAVVANPEFLREGSAVHDFFKPHRIVIGAANQDAAVQVASLYAFADCPVIVADPNTAEMIKYAANAFLATKVSFINEIAQICEAFGVDVGQVAEGIGHDPRIGPYFLGAGLGWGGSCLPKDIKALIHMAKVSSVSPRLLEAVQRVNASQKRQAVWKLRAMIGDLTGAVVGLLGLAFKPGTDDIRSAPSMELAAALLGSGVHVRAYDPVAMPRARLIAPNIAYHDDPLAMADGADALILVTEWPEFQNLDMAEVQRRMRRPVLLDGRNFWDGKAMQDLGFVYTGFGVGSSARKSRSFLDAALVGSEAL